MFMNFKQWMEMSVKFGYSKHPNITNPERNASSLLSPAGFNPLDQKAIHNEKLRKIVETRLDASTGKNWNILFLEFPVTGKDHQYRKYVRDYCIENNIDLENSITFAKNSTSGDVLTPWMVLHTIGHAITDNDKINLENFHVAVNLYSELDQNTSHSFDALPRNIAKTFMGRSGRIEPDTQKGDLGKYNTIQNYEEYEREIIAGYLWSKKIMLNPIHNGKNKQKEIELIKKSIENILNSLVGRIIIDLYN